MKTAATWFKGWRTKRNFVRIVENTDPRLLLDAGLPPEVIEARLRTPFWKF